MVVHAVWWVVGEIKNEAKLSQIELGLGCALQYITVATCFMSAFLLAVSPCTSPTLATLPEREEDSVIARTTLKSLLRLERIMLLSLCPLPAPGQILSPQLGVSQDFLEAGNNLS